MAGRVITPELIAAVCNAGGLESLGAEYISPSEMKEFIDKIGQLTDKSCFSQFIYSRKTFRKIKATDANCRVD